MAAEGYPIADRKQALHEYVTLGNCIFDYLAIS